MRGLLKISLKPESVDTPPIFSFWFTPTIKPSFIISLEGACLHIEFNFYSYHSSDGHQITQHWQPIELAFMILTGLQQTTTTKKFLQGWGTAQSPTPAHLYTKTQYRGNGLKLPSSSFSLEGAYLYTLLAVLWGSSF